MTGIIRGANGLKSTRRCPRSHPGSLLTNPGCNLIYMPRVLVVADEPWVRNEVHATLTAPGFELLDHEESSTAARTAVTDDIDVLIVDLQVGSMGGMAITRSIREATGDENGPGLPVVLLLDRSADGFLAKRAGAAAWLTKPFTSHQLQTAVDSAIESRSDSHAADDEEA